MAYILGLDIGGANTKGCCLEIEGDHVCRTKGDSIYLEVWNNPDGLWDVLRHLRNRCTSKNDKNPDGIALTMTAELCDGFLSKAEGVTAILRYAEDVFEGIPIYVWTIAEAFVSPADIKKDPLQAASANWLASASALARALALGNAGLSDRGPVILADMGSTTTDILPLESGRVLVKGKTDKERLQNGELLYSGILRTPVHALIDEVYLDGLICRLAKEYFSVSADVYRILGLISEEDYTVPTPDGKGRSMADCARRLARMVASEPEELGMKNIRLMALTIMEKQIGQIVHHILQTVSRKDLLLPGRLIVTGQGEFILREAARRLGWSAAPWWKMVPGGKPNLAMTSYSIAWLLAHYLERL